MCIRISFIYVLFTLFTWVLAGLNVSHLIHAIEQPCDFISGSWEEADNSTGRVFCFQPLYQVARECKQLCTAFCFCRRYLNPGLFWVQERLCWSFAPRWLLPPSLGFLFFLIKGCQLRSPFVCGLY